jgi:hypothetical protein
VLTLQQYRDVRGFVCSGVRSVLTLQQYREVKGFVCSGVSHVEMKCVSFEVSTAVTMKNAAFWDVTPCGCCKNRRFG